MITSLSYRQFAIADCLLRMCYVHVLKPCAFFRAASQLFAACWRGLVLQQQLRTAQPKGMRHCVPLRPFAEWVGYSSTDQAKHFVLLHTVGVRLYM
jgi:hypothetical protein